MARRQEIKAAMSGGTEAPQKRRGEISKTVREQRRSPGIGQGNPAGGNGIGGAYQAGLGRQLSSRVKAGAISQKQAQRTAGQRSTLAQTYGPNWRKQVFGGQAGQLGQLRQAASEGDLGSKVKLGQLLERRKQFLARAEKKPGIGPSEIVGKKRNY